MTDPQDETPTLTPFGSDVQDYHDWNGRRGEVKLINLASMVGDIALDTARDLIVVALSGGADVLVRPEHIHRITEPNEAPTAGDGRHQLARYLDAIDDETWYATAAVHEAAHAVVARAAGLEVRQATVAEDRTVLEGGGVIVAGDDAQVTTVHTLAGPLAHVRALASTRYDGLLTAAAVEVLAGQGDWGVVNRLRSDRYTVHVRQAITDAEALLDTPAVWEAITRVAQALRERKSLSGAEIDDVIGRDPARLSAHQIWNPTEQGQGPG